MNWVLETEKLLEQELPPVLGRLCLDYLTVTIKDLWFIDDVPDEFQFRRHWFRMEFIDQSECIGLKLEDQSRYDDEIVTMEVVTDPTSNSIKSFRSARMYSANLVFDAGIREPGMVRGLLPCDLHHVENADPNNTLPTGNVSWHAILHLFTDKGSMSVICHNRHSGKNVHDFEFEWFEYLGTLHI